MDHLYVSTTVVSNPPFLFLLLLHQFRIRRQDRNIVQTVETRDRFRTMDDTFIQRKTYSIMVFGRYIINENGSFQFQSDFGFGSMCCDNYQPPTWPSASCSLGYESFKLSVGEIYFFSRLRAFMRHLLKKLFETHVSCTRQWSL